MDSQIIAAIVILLAFFLPHLGLNLPTEQLTALVQAFVFLASTAWIAWRRSQLEESPTGVGDVTVFGTKRV